MNNFADRVSDKVIEKNSRLIVGIDPRVDMLPAPIKDSHPELSVERLVYSHGNAEIVSSAFVDFSTTIIESVKDEVIAIKAQIAFFEAWGPEGLRGLQKILSFAGEMDLLVIVDCKRGDIGTTSSAYKDAFFSGDGTAPFECDCITVNGYLGYDTIKPFEIALSEWGKGMFILGKTSNPTSDELQRVRCEGDGEVYEVMAGLIKEWGEEYIGECGYSSVGVVVGATDRGAVKRVREIADTSILLLPGFGAQGAGAGDITGVFDEKGLGGVVPSSRGIIYAGSGDDYGEMALKSARKAKDEINEIISKSG